MTVDEAVAENRRAHIHRDLRVLPGFGRLPLAGILREGVGVCALAWSRNDQVRAGPEWRRYVLMPLVRKYHRPQLFTCLAVETDDRAFRHRYDLLAATGFDHDWRSIAWSKSFPFPLGCSRCRIETEHLAAVNVAADLDHDASVDH